MKSALIVNVKTYKEGSGKNAINLIKYLERYSRKFNIMIALQPADIYQASKIAKNVKILAQHIDYEQQGAFTSKISPESIKETGAYGTLLNHAERRLSFKILKKSIERCKKLNLKTIVCVESVRKAKKISRLNPDYIVFEYPPLISTGNSISTVKPKEVKKFAHLINKTKSIPLCGAGISDNQDIKIALRLGTKGILIASAIVKTKNQKRFLSSLLKNV